MEKEGSEWNKKAGFHMEGLHVKIGEASEF